jgi:hypothetical protein
MILTINIDNLTRTQFLKITYLMVIIKKSITGQHWYGPEVMQAPALYQYYTSFDTRDAPALHQPKISLGPNKLSGFRV